MFYPDTILDLLEEYGGDVKAVATYLIKTFGGRDGALNKEELGQILANLEGLCGIDQETIDLLFAAIAGGDDSISLEDLVHYLLAV